MCWLACACRPFDTVIVMREGRGGNRQDAKGEGINRQDAKDAKGEGINRQDAKDAKGEGMIGWEMT